MNTRLLLFFQTMLLAVSAAFSQKVPVSRYIPANTGQKVQTAAATFNLSRFVASGNDDVEEYAPGGTGTIGQMYLNSSDLELMTDGTIRQVIGTRFTNITIPKGAIILNAYIQFTTKGDKNPAAGDIAIYGEASDSTAIFSDVAFNVSSRTLNADPVTWFGSTSATWGTTAGGTRGPDQRTPDLKTILQSIVSRNGWKPGNAVSFVFQGTGVRNSSSFEGDATKAAELVVQYSSTTAPAMEVINFPVPKTSEWYYLDDGTDQGTAWSTPSFNESAWQYGKGKLGYSDGAVTVLSYGPDATNKYITYYFRKKINVTSVAALADTLVLNLLRDDGAIIYVNGTEVVRSNMPSGAINYKTFSSTIVDGADESTYFTYRIPKNVLVNGINTIAAEVHQRDGTSSDLGFDLELQELTLPSLIRGPYLQVATPTSIHIRWRTDLPEQSRVRYGTVAGNLNLVQQDTAFVTEHEVVLSSLAYRTKYWYSIGGLANTLQGNADNYFVTLPVAGTKDLLRIGVIGDCGNNSTNQVSVRNQLQNYLGSNYMDSWILLGDNAYTYGTDAEFQAEFFNIYKDRFLKQNPLYPTPGNHDYNNGSSPEQNNHAVPYYSIFSMPTKGEAGGYPSNNQAYYSFDIGNIHFLSLDSYGREDSATRLYDTLGKQVQWIKNDLENNKNKGWIIAYWHHPPFTKGSHNSDTESELVNIRTNFIRILERYGVDLILCGHSHDYERSKLQRGHFGLETTFDPVVHNLSSSSGLYDSTDNSCPYLKDSATGYHGTMYVVSGSAGQLGGTTSGFPHDAMYYSNATTGGSMILEVQGNRLDAKWICSDGVIRDRFTMMKDVNARITYGIRLGQSASLAASFKGSYNWLPGGETTQTVTVTPQAVGSYTYMVKDNFSCISDTFTVNVAPAGSLPATWGALKGWFDATGNEVKLQWQTLQETNTSFFEIERSSDGANFEAIGKIPAAGNSAGVSNYKFSDKGIDYAVLVYYYRIRQTDKDGRFIYSSTMTVGLHVNTSQFDIQVVPNPGTNGEMKIRLSGRNDVSANIRLIDDAGRVSLNKQMILTTALQPFMPVVKHGVYFLVVTTAEGIITKRVVIK